MLWSYIHNRVSPSLMVLSFLDQVKLRKMLSKVWAVLCDSLTCWRILCCTRKISWSKDYKIIWYYSCFVCVVDLCTPCVLTSSFFNCQSFGMRKLLFETTFWNVFCHHVTLRAFMFTQFNFVLKSCGDVIIWTPGGRVLAAATKFSLKKFYDGYIERYIFKVKCNHVVTFIWRI